MTDSWAVNPKLLPHSQSGTRATSGVARKLGLRLPWTHWPNRAHFTGSHHAARAHHRARTRPAAGPVRAAIMSPSKAVRGPAQHDSREEDHRDHEHDTRDDTHPGRGLTEPTWPLVLFAAGMIFRRSGRFVRRFRCIRHMLNDAVHMSPAVGSIGPRDSLPSSAFLKPNRRIFLGYAIPTRVYV